MAGERQQLTIDEAHNLVKKALCACNTSEINAASVADALVAAEQDGLAGHGLSRVPSYAAQSLSGKVDGVVDARLDSVKGGALRIDAAGGFAYPALALARTEIEHRISDAGVVCASVHHSHHFGAAGYHVEQLANKGITAIIVGNSPKAIAPWGGSSALFGTNPIAFAAPRENHPPLVIDLSLSKVARGKVMVAARNNESIPGDWALDSQGNATTDPQAALNGAMLPMGDAKGAQLVLMVELLAAAVTGSNFGFEASSFFDADGDNPGVGQLILAFNTQALSGGQFAARCETLFSAMLQQENVRLPGARRYALREKTLANGISVAPDLLDELHALINREQ